FDVIEGRQRFNFSDWKHNPGELDEMVAAIQEGEMPPVQYWVVHPSGECPKRWAKIEQCKNVQNAKQ
ncbi:MAG TPA: heme-binding domain-containing protein, partial [Anaerolineales bacterium]|nr:heme-binding domain-containing protein [Anaerolineales bacterium]